jgi:arylsulfatase
MDPEKPNILLISSDHHRGDCLSSSGHPAVMTPQLDQLSFEGIRFTCAYSTCPACIPARQMIMTGRDSYGFGLHKYVEETEISPHHPTMQSLLTASGYQTQAIGKMHLFPQRCRYGFENMILCEEGRRLEGMRRDDYEWYLEENGFSGMAWAHGIGNNQAAARIWHLPEEVHSSNWITREGCKFLERKDPRKPFFLWISYTKPHPPYVPPSAYWEMYRNRKIPEPAKGRWLDESPIPLSILDNWSGRNVDLVDRQERENVMRAYYGLITQIDNQIGFFLGDLRERGLLDNTFIMYFSDHGDLMWDHGGMFKAALYEGSARVPLIVRPHAGFSWKRYGIQSGESFSCPVALYDIMPTLLEIAGAEIPVDIEGISLFSKNKREFLFGDYNGDHFVTDGRMKYLWHRAGGVEQLFDLENDPKEECNLENSEKRKSFRKLLLQFLKDKDPIAEGDDLLSIPHPGSIVTRQQNTWHNRGAHY